MTKPFFDRLKDYYCSIGEVLRSEADTASIFPNPTDIGTSRESIYAEVLRLHLPSSCNVAFGGFLFDQNGNESKQIDILITNEASLQFNFSNKDGSGTSFACIDGCVGVVSVKSRLDTAGLIDALENIASIPDKQPLTEDRCLSVVTISDYDEWPYKIIFASDGVTLPTLLDSLNSFYARHPGIPHHKPPNLIHVAGKYVIWRALKRGGITRGGTVIKPNSFYGLSDHADILALFWATTCIQETAMSSKYVKYVYWEMIDRIPFDS